MNDDAVVTTMGAELSRSFFLRAVRPLIDARFPTLPYAAALLGSGSDVLGYDDHRSQDHDWGCRLTLLVDAADERFVTSLDDLLERDLPDRFDGRPVRFSTTRDPRTRHKVEATTTPAFLTSRLGIDATCALAVIDWLVLTGQSVLEVTAGPVFHDASGTLTEARARLSWYPHEIWLYVLAAGWTRISQELPYIGRTGELGDETGSRIVAARLVRGLTHLAFLLHRQWPPYPKWTGVAFGQLDIATDLEPELAAVLDARSWPAREAAIAAAAHTLLTTQADRGLPVADPAVVPFHDRPTKIINPDIVAALVAPITEPVLVHLPTGLGSLEQWVDNVDVLSHPSRRAVLRRAYRALLPSTPPRHPRPTRQPRTTAAALQTPPGDASRYH